MKVKTIVSFNIFSSSSIVVFYSYHQWSLSVRAMLRRTNDLTSFRTKKEKKKLHVQKSKVDIFSLCFVFPLKNTWLYFRELIPHAHVRTIYENIPLRTSRGLNLENATYKPNWKGLFNNYSTSARWHVGCEMRAEAWAKHGVVCRQRKASRKASRKYRTAFRRSSKGQIRKDPCLSQNENHGLKTFYASLHLKWLWRQPSPSDQRHITWEQR